MPRQLFFLRYNTMGKSDRIWPHRNPAHHVSPDFKSNTGFRIQHRMRIGTFTFVCTVLFLFAIMEPELMFAAQALLKHRADSRHFRAHFGVTYAVANVLWLVLKAVNTSQHCTAQFLPTHLLWALHFLKIYPLQAEADLFCNTNHHTRNKWIWLVLFTLYTSLNLVCVIMAHHSLQCFVIFIHVRNTYCCHFSLHRLNWMHGLRTGISYIHHALWMSLNVQSSDQGCVNGSTSQAKSASTH
jgi:hypothetical protein